jgi:hypothetical protein
MQFDGTGARTRSLDELADVAVRRGDQLRRRRRQRRVVPGVALAMMLLVVALVRVGDDGKVDTVDTRPADRVEDDRAPTGTSIAGDGSNGSDVDAGAAPGADGSHVAPRSDAPESDDVVGRFEVGPLRLLYIDAHGAGQPSLWQFDVETKAHLRRDDADLCRPAASHGVVAYCKQGAVVVRDGDGRGDDRVVASNATDPDFAPSGDRLAYVDRSTGRDVIWTVGVDGSDRRRLTDGSGDDRFPTWSPDGSHLAYVSGSSVSRSVWIVAADGSNPRTVAPNYDGLDAYPLDWSPDGSQLAFTCAVTTSQSARTFRPSVGAVCLLDLVTGVSRAVTPDYQRATSPSWSPDGSMIAFTAHPGSTTTSEVWVMRADGTEQRKLWPRANDDDMAWFPVFLPGD